MTILQEGLRSRMEISRASHRSGPEDSDNGKGDEDDIGEAGDELGGDESENGNSGESHQT